MRTGAVRRTTLTYVSNDSVHNGSGIEIADLDGSGIDQVVYFPNSAQTNVTLGAIAVSVSPTGTGTRDGLLQTISNGTGGCTSIAYTTVATLPSSGHGNPYLNGPHVPVPAWAVSHISTTNGLSGSMGVTVSKDYAYNNPIYDRATDCSPVSPRSGDCQRGSWRTELGHHYNIRNPGRHARIRGQLTRARAERAAIRSGRRLVRRP